MSEHLKHGSDCAWALLMTIQNERDYNTSSMEDPTAANLSDARQYTFVTMKWPHQSKRGWVCKIDKMVEAGWYFAPTTECEDYTSCTYCKLSLDGWERKDDPWDNHYRRSPDCPFFTFAGTTAPSKRPKAKKGRASKSSRVSTQSNVTVASMIDESTGNFEVLGVDTTMEETVNNSIVSLQSTTSTATTKSKRKAPSRIKAAQTTKKAKTTKTKAKQEEPEPENEINTQEQESVGMLAKPKPKKQKGKKKATTPSPEPETEPEIEADTEEPEEIPRVMIDEQQEVAESKISIPKLEQQQPENRTSTASQRSSRSKPSQEEDIEEPPAIDDLSYPVLAQETPDEFQDAVEEPQTGISPTGPPEKASTPIPASQISPSKDQDGKTPASNMKLDATGTPNTKRLSRRSRASNRTLQPSPSAHQQTTRSPSQPSDIENAPPSSRPERVRPPLSSPGAPPPEWTPIDIETIFQAEEGQGVNVFEAAVSGNLTDQEKAMTVQQWVQHVAGQAESKLNAEAERIVSVFEQEGRRAMTALESIQCT